MPLVCFHLVEKHTPDHVVLQFGMIQEISHDVDTDTVLHAIDLKGKIEGYLCLLSYHLVGTEDHKDITDVLNAVQEIGRVQPSDPEAPNEDAATPATAATKRPSTTESPSTSTTPTGRPPIATPRVVPTPNPFPSTLHLSLSPTIPSPTPHPYPSPTIPPPTPHPCPESNIRPPTPWSFLELSPIPSFDLGIGPTPPDMQQEPPSHNTSTSPSSSIDPPHVQAEQAVGLPIVVEGRPKRISKTPPCGTGGANMNTKLGPRHPMKDMQDLLLIIQDSVRFKKGE
ncbi:extensin-like [Quercus suber]|uniref:extensin-like n=1 Tax=Quercus suber TaxID=58331 RepID=UPI0032DEF3EF